LYFWRNNFGDEIDVLLDQGTRLIPVELKSGETLNADFFKGLHKWRMLTKDTDSPAYLIYGGKEKLTRQGIRAVPWNKASQEVRNH
jgi:hypothetical protein